MRVLDIGSGWGALAQHLVHDWGAEVQGITLSREQLAYAQDRARRQGLERRMRFDFADYRAFEGKFDRVVSVGMIEHVGVGNLDTYFRKVRDFLTDDGVALIHGIGRKDGPSYNHPWLRKHIFPGSYAPALSEVTAAVERSGLWATDVEILRLHYGYTLRRWREAFDRNRERIRALQDERFCRMWELYLIATELFFTHQEGFVFQIQVTRNVDTVPLTRDYMVDTERALTGEDRQMQAAE
jgi:cyclopropane-fatty-acyl-phospholipid synthase